jgi:uncharacterized protein
MAENVPHPVVHIELRSPNLARAAAFYAELLGWRTDQVRVSGSSYLALDLSEAIGGGIAETDGDAAWIPYVEVPDVVGMAVRAVDLGAALPLPPREGPAGWRSVLTAPDGAQLALWQPKL